MVLLWRSGMEQYSTLCCLYLVDGAWYLILCVDSLILWKIINMPSWSPKVEGRNFSEEFCTLNFWTGWTTMPPLHWLLLCLRVIVIKPGFAHGHQSRPTGNHFHRVEKIPNLLRRLATLTFFIRVKAFRDSLGAELPHVQIFMNDGPNPLTWDAQLLSYRLRRNPAIFKD